jgi:hypothetical protein
MRHNPDYGIMTELVQRRAMPVDRLEIRFRLRHLDEIRPWAIESTVTTNAKIGAGGGDQRLGLR